MFMDEQWEPVFETPAPLGAALLDEKWPGWADVIDLDKFDIASFYSCVLSQLYAGYESGLRAVFDGDIDPDIVVAHGFDLKMFSDPGYGWSDLQKEWEYLINQRRSSDGQNDRSNT